MTFSVKLCIFIGMTEQNYQLERVKTEITQQAFAVLDRYRTDFFKETGILKPRYQIASEIILEAGRKQELSK